MADDRVEMTSEGTRALGRTLQEQMTRVDRMRKGLDLHNPANVLPEFLLRRELSLAAAAWQRGDLRQAALHCYALTRLR
jgi:hypothetical protein